MAAELDLNFTRPTTVELLVHKAREKAEGDGHRAHLGASMIGSECARALWYSFRWAARSDFSGTLSKTAMGKAFNEDDMGAGRMLGLFDLGHKIEEMTVESLVAAGFIVWEIDPKTQEQFLVSWGGHFGGSTDGVIKHDRDESIMIGDFEWRAGALLLLEVKSYNAERFRALRRKGVLESDPKYWAQAQVYMLGLRDQGAPIGGCLFISTCKDDSRIETQYIAFDEEKATALKDKGVAIADAQEPPLRAYDKDDHFRCRMCDYKDICWRGRHPERNCRTCLSSTPRLGGKWVCEKNPDSHIEIGDEDQRREQAYSCHRLIPSFIDGYHVIDANTDTRAISYEGPDGAAWTDTGPIVPALPEDATAVEKVMAAFDGTTINQEEAK